MASYLSYFTSNSSSQLQSSQQQRPAPSPSTWSSTFSSRITTLRKALTKDSEEDDPDNEDCSHVSNVLRAYYAEKGRAFPEWLPPDPKKPAPTMAQPQASYGQYPNNYAGYGAAQYTNQQVHGRGSSGGRGGLSDLWDPAPTQPVPPNSVPQSLRAPRPTPQSLRGHEAGVAAGSRSSLSSQQAASARPLPSQRAGSQQSVPPANVGGLGSKDRLRARLHGGERSNSPLSNSGQQAQTEQEIYTSHGSGTASPYVSASEPWSTGGDDYGYGGGYSGVATGSRYESAQPVRPRPGGPR